jgi:hypothetical protein
VALCVAVTLRTLAPFPQPGTAAIAGAEETYQTLAPAVTGMRRTPAGAVEAMAVPDRTHDSATMTAAATAIAALRLITGPCRCRAVAGISP